MRDLCDDWKEAYGGTAPGGQIGSSVKPLLSREPWDRIRTAFRSYLSQTEAAYASPSRFAQTFGTWAGTKAAPTKTRGMTATMDSARRYIESEEKRERRARGEVEG